MVANTLANLLENEIIMASRRREEDIVQYVPEVLAVMPFSERKEPDMTSVLAELEGRGAVIFIPEYNRRRQHVAKGNEIVLSPTDRYGTLTRLVSNQETMAMSVGFKDLRVLKRNNGREQAGAYRCFMLVDDFGNWHEGWNSFQWYATEEEQNIIQERGLESEPDTLEFEHFVHPNKALSIFGSRYAKVCSIEERVTDEKKHYTLLVKRLLAGKVRLPEWVSRGPLPRSHKIRYGVTRPVTGKVLEARLILPEIQGEYMLLGITREGRIEEYSSETTPDPINVLRYAASHLKSLRKYQERLRFFKKSVDLAFFVHDLELGENPDGIRNPGWEIPEVVRDYRQPRKRNRYNAFQYNDCVMLLYRVKDKTVRIAE